nr:TetR/AcrR family transcriptional regulator [Streptomyces sp. NBC_00899]
MTEKSKGPRPGGGQPDKRRAILTGALALFARDGYTRASLDAIAAAAGVSSRTIYNHFRDKAQLFEAVIQESSGRVAETQIAIIDRHLSKIVDLETDLVEFGLAWLAVMDSAAAPHFALVRQINADLEHIPQTAIDAWQETGPRRVRGELAERLGRIADRGSLRIPDPDRAAVHLMLLVSNDNLPYGADRRDEKELTAMVTAGVHTFLHGCQP